MSIFEIRGENFCLDGKPFRIMSGAMHYFRIVPGYWRDRLLKLKACGLNTVETVIPWNLHEPQKGRFNFDGIADVEAYIRLAGELGLKVIIRPGPYVCTEWDFGGFPAWLLNEEGIGFRCLNKAFCACVEPYFNELFKRLSPLCCSNGGPIIAAQVENEYGSYGDDSEYLRYLRDMIHKGMGGVLLFTSDGPEDLLLENGTLPEVFKTVNFGSNWSGALKQLKKHQPDGPKMCMEYWNGWFDHWGNEHITRGPEDAAKELDGMLEAGMSVNLYMFHGGTNFGFYNGANHQEKYEPTVTSYDYDAPVSENGALTKKYELFHNILLKHGFTGLEAAESPKPRKFGTVKLTQKQGLFESLDRLCSPVHNAQPLPMERIGQNFGFILYRTHVSGPRKGCNITMEKIRDRAQVFVNGVFIKTIYREDAEKTLTVDFEKSDNRLDILVENMGRVNYGTHVLEFKGITEYVRLDMQKHYGWNMYPLSLDHPEYIEYCGKVMPGEPVFYRDYFDVDEPADTYFDASGWQKGVVFVNGFNIGRYWSIGPQRTLYIPAPLLKKGKNELVVFELHGCEAQKAELNFR